MAAGELTRRWAVAILGIPIVIGILYEGGWFLAAPVAALAGLGTLEVFRLARRTGIRPVVWLGTSGSVSMVLAAAQWPAFRDFSIPALAVVGLVAGASLVTATFWRGAGGRPLAASAMTVLAVGYVGLALAVVPLLHQMPSERSWGGDSHSQVAGLLVVALPLASTWLGDASAFFAGRAWGDKRLAPEISPNKSWVGAWAGVLGGAFGAMVWYVVADGRLPGLPVSGLPMAAGIGAVLGVAAIVGDLVESVLKREAGVKDSGSVFPGHGGVLDRIDALIFTIPIAYSLLLILDGTA